MGHFLNRNAMQLITLKRHSTAFTMRQWALKCYEDGGFYFSPVPDVENWMLTYFSGKSINWPNL